MGKEKRKRAERDWSGHRILEYDIGARVGSGTFADVYEGRPVNGAADRRLCMKIEERASGNLAAEFKILTALAGEYTPRAYEHVRIDKYNVLVLELMGPSLDALTKKGPGKFSVSTVAATAAQIMACIQHVHSHGIVHRDIKPHNFVIGQRGRHHKLYMLDFGLAKNFTTSVGAHCAFRTGRPFVGTARYVSVNAHMGYEQGRRDDMESIAYMLIYTAKGSLPWQGLPQKDKQARLEMIRTVKDSTDPRELCDGLPSVFAEFLTHTRTLRFEEEPRYADFQEAFAALIQQDVRMDWIESGLASKLCDDVEQGSTRAWAKARARLVRDAERERERVPQMVMEQRALEP